MYTREARCACATRGHTRHRTLAHSANSSANSSAIHMMRMASVLTSSSSSSVSPTSLPRPHMSCTLSSAPTAMSDGTISARSRRDLGTISARSRRACRRRRRRRPRCCGTGAQGSPSRLSRRRAWRAGTSADRRSKPAFIESSRDIRRDPSPRQHAALGACPRRGEGSSPASAVPS